MVCLLLMTLLTILAVGLMTLAAIELRRSSRGDDQAVAQANARLALMLAIGQLQKTLGPDQRVSASAELLAESGSQPHWTGVWRATRDDGSSFFSRDDLSGGLSDSRWPAKSSPAERVMEWLVSGEGNPKTGPTADSVVIGYDGAAPIKVGKIPVKRGDGSPGGHHAWWTGDLGVRANIGTTDPRSDTQVARGSPGGDPWFRVMASQAADASLMEGGVRLREDETARLASRRTVSLTTAGEAWSARHAFDFTVDSQGVLADVAHGGLKRDLTAFFEGEGDIPAWKKIPGISADDPLVGEPGDGQSRHTEASPRFGMLRDWARLGAPFSGKNVASKLPEVAAVSGRGGSTPYTADSEALALANETPVIVKGNRKAGLQPILVEATNFIQMSYYQLSGFVEKRYQLRQLMYPRVVLWNPYNVELKFEPSIVMIQCNGRQEMNTKTSSGSTIEWLCFEGGRNINFASGFFNILMSQAYQDPYMGSYYFSIPATTFGPGECLVFSPAKSAEYDGLSVYHPGDYNLNNNILSCNVPPDPSRSYYVSASDINDKGFTFVPVEFWYAPSSFVVNGRRGVENQSDDTRAVLKNTENRSVVTFDVFDSLPQIAVVSTSLQYGAGKEPRITWNDRSHMPMELLDERRPRPTVIPNVRTREGVRLRWFREHPSNRLNSGPLAGTPHFEDALLGNWNPRASFVMRSPWENIAGTLPSGGAMGGPWFFGAYTRDLYDQAVGWTEQTPVLSGGRYHGNPFGPPQDGADRYVLFDVPRGETGVVSLGQLQHARISELIWHPSYAIGNSLAEPRLGTGGTKGLSRSAAVATDSKASGMGGFHENQIGWSSDNQRSTSKDEWAVAARAILGRAPERNNLVYDLSFEVNHTLWDRYFLSTGGAAGKRSFLADPEASPLPDARMRLAPGAGGGATEGDLTDFHRAASRLMVDGAFNVNSTRVEAWKALLGSTRPSGYGSGPNVPFPRVLDPPGGAWRNGGAADAGEVWDGYRELTPDEIDRLARAIVDEVKRRGPFISLADFVNRRLAEDETGRMGALQAAIEKAGLNSTLTAANPLNNSSSLPDYRHPDNIPDATLMEQTLKPASTAWGAPAWLTQADVLQVLGPALTARSDSFVIRAFGDATDASGKVTARAWCEAVVQRTPAPLDPDESGLNPRLAGAAGDFGRRFIVKSFRWLAPSEI